MIKVADVTREASGFTVVIEGDSYAEVASSEARKTAYEIRTKHGAEGFSLAVSNTPYAVEVGPDGKVAELVEADAIRSAMAKGTLRYRNNFRLQPGLR